jgi:uncharacterized membrane protein YuzA (DUF378 family)
MTDLKDFQLDEKRRRHGAGGNWKQRVVANGAFMKVLDVLTAILVIVGALNWGMVGSAGFNLVAALFGQTALASVVYILVGIAAVYQAARMFKTRAPVLAHA